MGDLFQVEDIQRLAGLGDEVVRGDRGLAERALGRRQPGVERAGRQKFQEIASMVHPYSPTKPLQYR